MLEPNLGYDKKKHVLVITKSLPMKVNVYITNSFPAACLGLKRGKSLTLGHMGSPLKNQNFEKVFSAC